MEEIRPRAALITGKRYDTRSWTSWEVLKVLLSTETSYPARLLLLEDFGNCKSVRSVNTEHIRGCLWNDHERETLLDPLRLNPNLEELSITVHSREETSYWRVVLCRSSHLRKLELIIADEGFTDYSGSTLVDFVKGLRGHPKSPLKELVIEAGTRLLKFSVTPIADMVQCSSRLHRFVLGVCRDLDGTEIQALSDSLKHSSSLRTLEVKYGTESMSKVLLEVFTGVRSTRCVNNLHLWEVHLKELVSLLPHLMKARIAHITIHGDGHYGSTVGRRDHWREIGRALLKGTGVQTLSLNCGASCSTLSRIEQVFDTSQRSANLSLSLYSDCLSGEHQDALMSFLALARLRDIHFTIGDCRVSSVLEEAMDSISKNKDVETCSIRFENSRWVTDPKSFPRPFLIPSYKDRRRVFDLVLEKIFLNSSIKQLTLERSFLNARRLTEEEEFKQLLLLSQRSTSLQKLEVQCEDWVLDGKVANLQDAINRNANRNAGHAQFISTVRQAGLHFSRIKAGRILICGSPYAEIRCSDRQTCLLPEGTEVAKDLLPVKIQESIRIQLKEIAKNLEEEKYFQHRAQEGTGEGGVVRINDEVIEVYAPVGDPELELIFVHGIHDDEMDSNPYLTRWSTRDNREECWLNTWLVSETDVDLRQARILTVTYDSSIKKNSEKGNMCIFLVAENLRHSLIKDAGVGQLDSCPVLIVFHSLGGLLMKEVCVQASHVQSREEDMAKYKKFLTNIRGFFFYSTPHSLGPQALWIRRKLFPLLAA
ncbi:hypothetical protein R1sor_011051 [Riccia sorocarpa]|uniref:Uncharacterized protein n=1 Tax=Riccia sorocarpa TaxID=122646 RepID=A0ABD3HZR7_9MARC